jgi:hypothetical protein
MAPQAVARVMFLYLVGFHISDRTKRAELPLRDAFKEEMSMNTFLVVFLRVMICAGLLFFADAKQGLACSCALQEIPDAVSSADYIFIGTITTRQDIPPDASGIISSADPAYFEVAVEWTLKGTPLSPVTVVTARDSSSCGYPFKEGIRYLIFGYRSDRTEGSQSPRRSFISTNICTRTTDQGVDVVAAQVKALLMGG